jgi:hypothetical protein
MRGAVQIFPPSARLLPRQRALLGMRAIRFAGEVVFVYPLIDVMKDRGKGRAEDLHMVGVHLDEFAVRVTCGSLSGHVGGDHAILAPASDKHGAGHCRIVHACRPTRIQEVKPHLRVSAPRFAP